MLDCDGNSEFFAQSIELIDYIGILDNIIFKIYHHDHGEDTVKDSLRDIFDVDVNLYTISGFPAFAHSSKISNKKS